VLCADVHLRDAVPECRTDDFLAAQFRKLQAIRDLQEANGGCPVLCAGDVFDHWKPSPWLLQAVIPLVRNWIVVPGQHDLPQHSLALFDKSGLAVLERAGCVQVLEDPVGPVAIKDGEAIVSGFPWGAEPSGIAGDEEPYKRVALIHRLVYPGKPPFPGAESKGGPPKDLLRKMKGFDLVVSGDNHQTFTDAAGGTASLTTGGPKRTLELSAPQILVNPGSMMRTTAAQADHEPSVFLWWAESNAVERVVLPHEKGVVSREHIDRDKARDERISAFVERLRDDVEMGLDFRDNLRRFLAENETPKAVEQLVWEIVDGKTS
jgi:hypothetical protein